MSINSYQNILSFSIIGHKGHTKKAKIMNCHSSDTKQEFKGMI